MAREENIYGHDKLPFFVSGRCLFRNTNSLLSKTFLDIARSRRNRIKNRVRAYPAGKMVRRICLHKRKKELINGILLPEENPFVSILLYHLLHPVLETHCPRNTHRHHTSRAGDLPQPLALRSPRPQPSSHLRPIPRPNMSRYASRHDPILDKMQIRQRIRINLLAHDRRQHRDPCPLFRRMHRHLRRYEGCC